MMMTFAGSFGKRGHRRREGRGGHIGGQGTGPTRRVSSVVVVAPSLFGIRLGYGRCRPVVVVVLIVVAVRWFVRRFSVVLVAAAAAAIVAILHTGHLSFFLAGADLV